jgi:thiamine-phosphate pyrophosphorylase
MKPLADCRLYTFVDTAYLKGRPVADVARALCDGGADLIQLRAKNAPLDDIRKMGAEILKVTQAARVGLVINDHLSIALELGADLCHLGQEDFFDAGFTHVSQVIPRNSPLRIGLSTHAPDQALRAVAAGAHYVAIGPVYATPTKPQATPVTLEYVTWASRNLTVPWFAIGGINLQNVNQVIDAGASRICVVSAILNPQDTRQATATFREAIHKN